MPNQQILFLELNEVNFEYVQRYGAQGKLPHLAAFIDRHGYAETTSEEKYEELEPWIQWVTAHTGLSLAEHGIFRLGDINTVDLEQIWERLAAHGLKVGAISPMNAKCRGDKWDFFVPDPWTNTGVVANGTVRRLYNSVAQVVNDNAQSRITPASLINLAIGSLVSASPSNYPRYFNYLRQVRSKPWLKAIFLDQLLADLFVRMVAKHKTNFATLFLNAAAHIQHHYMFSSSIYDGAMQNPEWYLPKGQDPLLDVYAAYDNILGDVIHRFPDARIMLGTGLHQDPHSALTFYWRIKDHAHYLSKIGVPFESVEPRMSRDFLILCGNGEAAQSAEKILNSAVAEDGQLLFEVDNRGDDLFVMLTYPDDIRAMKTYSVSGQPFAGLAEDVAFVAVKNGTHNGIGYFADSGAFAKLSGERFALATMPDRIMSAYGLDGGMRGRAAA